MPDADDRHVLAAAIASQSEAIVTFNLSDFPPKALPGSICAVHPDAFLCDLLSEYAQEIVAALSKQRARLHNPPQSPAEFLATLERQQLRSFVAALRLLNAQI